MPGPWYPRNHAPAIVAIGPIPWTARTARDACASPEVVKTAADFLLEGELKSGQPGTNGHRTIDILSLIHISEPTRPY